MKRLCQSCAGASAPATLPFKAVQRQIVWYEGSWKSSISFHGKLQLPSFLVYQQKCLALLQSLSGLSRKEDLSKDQKHFLSTEDMHFMDC